MKKYARACMMAFSMFCAIPCPCPCWDDDARPLATLFLPAVGVWTGALWTLLAYLIRKTGLPLFFGAALLCAFPFLITGFMHMDGFMDVTDAVKSWRDLDERRRILKDPHTGSFAVIACVLLILTQFSLFASAKADANIYALILIPTASRTAAGFCVTALRPISESQYAGAYRKGAKKSHAVLFCAIFLLTVLLGFLLLGKYGCIPLGVTAGYLLALCRAFRSLGGMSGDISGYALTFGELCGVALYALI